MKTGLKTILEAMNLLEKDIRENRMLQDDVELPLRMAQINVVNGLSDDATVATVLLTTMKAGFHLGQLHMVLDVLAGDKLSRGRNAPEKRDLLRTWREAALELTLALQEIIASS